MRRVLFSVSAAVCVSTALTAAAPLPAKDIDRAIVLGRANKTDDLTIRCTAEPNHTGLAFGLIGAAVTSKQNRNKQFDVTAASARGRIALAAWAATKVNQPFTADNVSPDMLADQLSVDVATRMPDVTSDAEIPEIITRLSLHATTDSKDKVLAPTTLTLRPMEWKNQTGARVDYKDASATFDGFDVRNLFALTEDTIQLDVITDGRDRKCGLGHLPSLMKR